MPAACRGSADLKTVGLTRRGPPTCRHRREWSEHAKEQSRRNHISSHLSLRAKVGRPRGSRPTFLPFNNQNSTIINRQFFLCHAAGDKSAGRGGPALPSVARSSSCAGGREEEELRPAWSRAHIPRRRQQSVPHSGVREALLAPMAAPALPDVARSSSCAGGRGRVPILAAVLNSGGRDDHPP